MQVGVTMPAASELITEVISETLAESLKDAEVARALRQAAHAYKYFSLAKTGFEFGFHVAGQNYPGAVLVLARHVLTDTAGSGAASFIVEQGGFAARIQLDAGGAARHRDVVGVMMGGHHPESELSIFNHEPFWDVLHSDEVAAKAMKAAETATSMANSASAMAVRIAPRIYHRLSLASIAKYSGTWVGKDRQGWGRLTFPEQGAYSGVWDGGEPTGFGRRDFADGSYYLGEIRQGRTAHAQSTKALGMSVSSDGKRVFIGEHGFPFVLFNAGEFGDHDPLIFPNGFGVQVTPEKCTRGYWNANSAKHTFEMKEEFDEKLAQQAKAMFEEAQYRQYMLVAAAKEGVKIAELRYQAAIKNARWRTVLKAAEAREGLYAFDIGQL